MKRRSPRFEVYRAKDGWRWRLKAGNGRVIATGEAHTRKRDAVRAIDGVTAAVSRMRRGPSLLPGGPRTFAVRG